MTEAELAELRKNMADYFSGEIGKSLFAHKIIDLLNHIDRQQKAIDVYRTQFNDVMVGGNHLASCLIGSLGGGFAAKFPPSMNSTDALHAIVSISTYDVWCCWKSIMNARDEITKAEAILRGEDV